MKVLLIVLAVIVGAPVYAFFGFLVFLAYEKNCGSDWRLDWRNDEPHVGGIIGLWPMVIAGGVIAVPVLLVYRVIDGIASKEDR